MHPEIMRKMQEAAQGHYDLRSVIPDQMAASRTGFAIFSSKEKLAGLKRFEAYVRHKESRGLTVHVVTEDEFRGGVGVEAAANIRNWLKRNYKPKKLLYALFLGNPHPRQGDTPMKKVSSDWRAIKDIIAAGHMDEYVKQNPEFDAYDGALPTDYYFVDLDGEWDKNKNGLLADDGDYGDGGIDGQVDVYVGRIPYYGVDVKVGNARDVDRMLDRIVRYETEQGDLSWRHNIFYNGGIFRRDRTFYEQAVAYNGAALYRQARHGSSLWYAPEREGHVGAGENAKLVSGKYGFAYFQGHGFATAGGGMNTREAGKIRDVYPKVYASGACLVAYPENPNNMMYSLLRSSGIGAFGGTRSVTGCTGNKWVRHEYYARMMFGNSLGELLWRMRAEQSKGGRIGATNFLINLYGDPSVVPMPQVYGPPIGVSPGWKVRLRTVEGSDAVFEIPFEVRNNTREQAKYRLEFHPLLGQANRTISLAAGAYTRIPAKLKGLGRLPAGTHDLPFRVTRLTPPALGGPAEAQELRNGDVDAPASARSLADDRLREEGVIVDVAPRTVQCSADFDRPLVASSFDEKRKVSIPVSPAEVQVEGVAGKAFRLARHTGTLQPGVWSERNNFSISLFLKLTKHAKALDLVNCDALSLTLNEGKIGIWFSISRFSAGTTHREHIKSSLAVPKGVWTFASFRVDRLNQRVRMMVGDQVEELPFKIEPVSRLHCDKLDIGRRVDPRNEYAVDELTIHNYLLSDAEVALMKRQATAFAQSPETATVINPARVSFTWRGGAEASAYKLVLADNRDFASAREFVTDKQEHTISRLSDHTTYFWRVDVCADETWHQSRLRRSFKTDGSVKPVKIEAEDNFLVAHAAIIREPGYARELSPYLKGLTEAQKKGLRYEKLSGPKWLEIYSDGHLFTNYGPREDDQGINTFRVRIKASDGNSEVVRFRVLVVSKRSHWTSKVSASHDGNYRGDKALDGDLRSLWHTPWAGRKPRHPHTLVVDMKDAGPLTGFNYQPRIVGPHAAHGRVKGYRFYVSADGKEWRQPVSEGVFRHTTDLQTVTFEPTPAVRFFKFESLSDWSDRSMTVIPELDVIPARE